MASPPPPSTAPYDLHRMVALAGAGQLLVPAKCSQQFRKLIHSHSLSQAQQMASGTSNLLPPPDATSAAAAAAPAVSADPQTAGDQLDGSPHPILPHLPYSPYGSPSSFPRVRQKPLRETSCVDSVTKTEPGPKWEDEEYMQLNQYKLSGVVGQVRLGEKK